MCCCPLTIFAFVLAAVFFLSGPPPQFSFFYCLSPTAQYLLFFRFSPRNPLPPPPPAVHSIRSCFLSHMGDCVSLVPFLPSLFSFLRKQRPPVAVAVPYFFSLPRFAESPVASTVHSFLRLFSFPPLLSFLTRAASLCHVSSACPSAAAPV